ncbi:7-carboxy-7-deazaguanine synthase QueE [Colwellia sp. 1_MG-2023]|jgi:7-carboxy-7-deazaguanine synthase|uniref:7-carboxy-7-deazaguanine synthase QueE n=1 Tax=unclassified Colwellia TaxID=196834 RepID=UPI001C09A5AB|nr:MULTISPECIES: 7-carboxy-7-deazaguanine synthase QueE [unclassified Colwellia]MBU2924783.1 7-carboxy-7-deazaguanine synthase QueE [Colwellia sp. C2M11]MDO6489529.1 7-carboxy-7-deazaguanine synthase QueE [Colwellia sp. 6_MG-2023]MDO6653856.1 7-carboxy-7-deazaguanine synthase QueE [Colwellia sp. 3_MG-2023]MDO6667016.1 7-carboxy-7-deazaguanine synthase QueE [Colwellia sp. 2_MG-2023]MDO6691438.1 7-carboxy-7-deazaguanine synthase QueE [Colwellia sp. 1_MG-2023]
MIQYKINEMFETIQGEGSFTGQPSIFIRLQGCPVGCSWCDTKHTWEVELSDEVTKEKMLAKSQETPQWSNLSVTQIKALVTEQGYQAKHVVITGGEPCMVDLTPLCDAFEDIGYSTQVETSGTFDILVSTKCWVTVSPKINMRGGYPILSSAMARADEIKHPVATEQHVDDLKTLLAEHDIGNTPIYLQPISQKDRATQLAIDTCIANNWRLSIQVHKYIGIE